MLSVRSCASLFVEKWECKGEHKRALKVRRVWGDDSTLCYRDIISISSSIFKDSFDWPARCVRVYPAPKKIVKRGCRKLAYSAMLEIMEEKKEWKKALILHT